MDLPAELAKERARTQPDYVVYTPKSLDGSPTHDGGNEHFLVMDGPGGSLMAFWTQSTVESFGDHRIVFSRSGDEGETWSEPCKIAGPSVKGECHQASWQIPMMSKSGRVYVLWNQYIGVADVHHQFTGTMDGCFSDDGGATWSTPETAPMPRSPHDHPDPSVPANWIVWQRPDRISKGKHFVGFTRWLSKEVARPPYQDAEGKVLGWSTESVTEFMRFENIDDDPAVKDLQISYFAQGENALHVPFYLDPLNRVAQEPSVVRLPDGRLFCVMRAVTGYPWYSVSSDEGETWPDPMPLRRKDHGRVIEEPMCCCPIYPLSDGRYFLVHHLRRDGLAYDDAAHNRWPVYIAVAEFRPQAQQPLWFSESRLLFTHDGVGMGPRKRTDLGVYTSVTNRNGNDVLWHPDRKFFLLGKKISPEIIEGLNAPQTG